jgi:hypothetical protein
VFGDGRVFFRGLEYATTSQEKVKELIAEFLKVNYFCLEDYYPPDATDSPDAITSITIGGRSKTVRHSLYSAAAPRKLFLLEQRIDEIANTVQWIR